MKLQQFLTYGMAIQAPKKMNFNIQSLFTFGDSYTTTGFNISSAQPSLDNPMGNPHLGEGTTANGPNWVGYLTTTYNQTTTLNYNLAVYGATVNDSVVANVPTDLVHQVLDQFRPNYCAAALQSNPAWSSDSAVFAIWIGINERSLNLIFLGSVYYSYFDSDPIGKIAQVFDSYINLLHELYACGARHFLLINVPPISRSPRMLPFDPWKRSVHEKSVLEFNRQLKVAAADWENDYQDASMAVYDAWSFMTDILDHPRRYGFADSSCSGGRCVWWDDLHPTSAFHRMLAVDVQRFLARHLG